LAKDGLKLFQKKYQNSFRANVICKGLYIHIYFLKF